MVCMNRHLIKGFDAPFGESTLNPDLRKDGQLKEPEITLLSLWCLCLSYRLQLGTGTWWNITICSPCACILTKKKKKKKQTCNPQWGVELPSLVFLLSTSELNAQEKWPIFPQTLCIWRQGKRLGLRKHSVVNSLLAVSITFWLHGLWFSWIDAPGFTFNTSRVSTR